jgi:hypothetical protein
MDRTSSAVAFSVVLALYVPLCARDVRVVTLPRERAASLWHAPEALQEHDLFYGPWGAERSPSDAVAYTLVEYKHSGVNPGMTVRDPSGRRWSVKQAAPGDQPAEGPIEVVVSRLLSAAGYHQPPVYYLPSFTLIDDWGRRTEGGGRFRLHDKTLKDVGEWSWQQNPFVETTPYRGLLALLMMLNSSDLKNSNNTLYEHRTGDLVEEWYVVRDLGTALGSTGRFAPRRGDPDAFERQRFILDIQGGFVRFDYRGWHQELVRDRLTTDDVRWASDLLAALTERQWHDAFRAGGYAAPVADRFIRKLKANILRGQSLPVSRSSDPALMRP